MLTFSHVILLFVAAASRSCFSWYAVITVLMSPFHESLLGGVPLSMTRGSGNPYILARCRTWTAHVRELSLQVDVVLAVTLPLQEE